MNRAWQDAAGTETWTWLALVAAFLLLSLGISWWLNRGRRRRWRRRR